MSAGSRAMALGQMLLAEEQPRIAARVGQFAVTALVILCITAPAITISSSLPWFKAEQLAVPVFAAVYGWLLLAGRAAPLRMNGLWIAGGLYLVCNLISLAYGWAFLGHEVIVRDFYEFPKILLPVAFYTMGRETPMTEAGLLRLRRWMIAAVAVICAYAAAQWLNLGISQTLANYYSGGEHIEGALSHYRRVYSTMGNPNVLGQLMTWSIAMFALAVLYRIGSMAVNFTVMLASSVTLVMTGSRYGLINTGVAFAVIFLLPGVFRRKRKAPLTLLLVLLPLFAGVTFYLVGRNQTTLDRIVTLSNPMQADSLRTRLDLLWQDAEREIAQSPLFGHGPAKTIFSGIVTDSEYLDVLKEFGFVGFFVYLTYFGVPLAALWKGLRRGSRAGSSGGDVWAASLWITRVGFLMGLTALLMNIGMSTFYNASLQGFLWLMLGIAVRASQKASAAEFAG